MSGSVRLRSHLAQAPTLPGRLTIRADDGDMTARDGVLGEQAVRVLAEIVRLEKELDAGPLVVPGSRGQPMPTRLLGELRAHRWLLARLLAEGSSPAGPPAADAVDALRMSWEDSGAL
jgi:hypothetical protein